MGQGKYGRQAVGDTDVCCFSCLLFSFGRCLGLGGVGCCLGIPFALFSAFDPLLIAAID
jgi:hypothetical protein